MVSIGSGVVATSKHLQIKNVDKVCLKNRGYFIFLRLADGQILYWCCPPYCNIDTNYIPELRNRYVLIK